MDIESVNKTEGAIDTTPLANEYFTTFDIPQRHLRS